MIDYLFIVAGMIAFYFGSCCLVASWRMWSARLAWEKAPNAWMNAVSGLETSSLDVRFVAAVGAVGNSELVTAPWIALTVSSEALVVESMIPWPIHGPKVVCTPEDGRLRNAGGTVIGPEDQFAISVRSNKDRFVQMLDDLGWLLPDDDGDEGGLLR